MCLLEDIDIRCFWDAVAYMEEWSFLFYTLHFSVMTSPKPCINTNVLPKCGNNAIQETRNIWAVFPQILITEIFINNSAGTILGHIQL